jgi:thiol-disulfide isomerase/thioredoxin
MSEVPGPDGEGEERGGWWPLVILIVAVVLIGGAVGFLVLNREAAAPEVVVARAEGPYARFAVGPMAKLETHAEPRPVPQTPFFDREGKPVTLADYRGRVAVVNIWATWCAPCVTEMPTLAALQQAYPQDRLVVVPVSVDREEAVADAKSFIDVHEPLPLLTNPDFSLPFAMKIKGLPATVVLDAQGREIARLSGESDWSSPEAKAFFDAVLADQD